MSGDNRSNTRLPITQVWIATPVSYLDLGNELGDGITNALLDIEGVKEVEHYDQYRVLAGIVGDSDFDALAALAGIRRQIENVFRAHGLLQPAMVDDDARHETALREAEDAFWASIAGSYPEATSGDFPPDAQASFSDAMAAAVDTWLAANVASEMSPCSPARRGR